MEGKEGMDRDKVNDDCFKARRDPVDDRREEIMDWGRSKLLETKLLALRAVSWMS